MSTLRTSVSALERNFIETRNACTDVASIELDHGRRIKWLEDARSAADKQCGEQVALLRDRLDGQESRLKVAEQAHSTLAADMLQLGSEINSRLDALEALERRVAELANQNALVEAIDRQLRDMQQFIVEAAERAQQQQQQQQVPPATAVQPRNPFSVVAVVDDRIMKVEGLTKAPAQPAAVVQPPQPTQAPAVQGVGVNPAFQVTTADSIAGILELQRQAQQAFMARRQAQPPVVGIEGVGL